MEPQHSQTQVSASTSEDEGALQGRAKRVQTPSPRAPMVSRETFDARARRVQGHDTTLPLTRSKASWRLWGSSFTRLSNLRGGAREIAKGIAFANLSNHRRLRGRLERIREAGCATILNLHRVAPADGSDYKPLEPSLFDELLAFVTREFSVVTIAELAAPASKPKLVLSFDDGYRDFIEYTIPILKRYGLRANQNVIPKCIDSGLPPLNVLAQDFVGKAPEDRIRRLRISGFSAPYDSLFGRKLSVFLKMRPQSAQDAIAAELLPQLFDWEGFVPTPMMTIDEIKSIDHHEIGAHSFCHASMEYETDEYLDHDVDLCAAYFREKLGRSMNIYAFPNGSCRSGQVERILARGVDNVLMVGERFDKGDRIHTRFTFDARSRSEMRFKALGGFSAP